MSYSPVCIFSHPHWLYITACCLHSTLSSSSVTAGGSQYVICAKYEIHKTFNQQLQPRGYCSDITHAICWTLSSPSFPAHAVPPFNLALTRSPKGLSMHKLLLHSKFLWFGIEAEISCVWSVCWGNPGVPFGLSFSNYSNTTPSVKPRFLTSTN